MKLRETVAREIAKNRSAGMMWCPPMKTEEQCDLVIATFIEAFEKVGLRDEDARRIEKAFLGCRCASEKWPSPATVIASIRSIPKSYDAPALPNLSESQIEENKNRIAEMISTIKFGAK